MPGRVPLAEYRLLEGGDDKDGVREVDTLSIMMRDRGLRVFGRSLMFIESIHPGGQYTNILSQCLHFQFPDLPWCAIFLQ